MHKPLVVIALPVLALLVGACTAANTVWPRWLHDNQGHSSSSQTSGPSSSSSMEGLCNENLRDFPSSGRSGAVASSTGRVYAMQSAGVLACFMSTSEPYSDLIWEASVGEGVFTPIAWDEGLNGVWMATGSDVYLLLDKGTHAQELHLALESVVFRSHAAPILMQSVAVLAGSSLLYGISADPTSSSLSVEWRTPLMTAVGGRCVPTTPCVSTSTGLVWVPCDNTLYGVVAKNGTISKTAELFSSREVASDLICTDGMVLYVAADGVITMMSEATLSVVSTFATNTVRPADDELFMSLALREDRLYFGSDGRQLMAFYANTTAPEIQFLWEHLLSTTEVTVPQAMAVDARGVVYVPSRSAVFGFYPNGSLAIGKTSIEVVQELSPLHLQTPSAPILDSKGTLWVGANPYQVGKSCPSRECGGTDNGRCNACTGACDCLGVWGGPTCTQQTGCFSRGVWNAQDQHCDCNAGYGGTHCETRQTASSTYNGWKWWGFVVLGIAGGSTVATAVGGVLYALWSKRRMGQWDDDFVDDPESSGEDY